MFSVFQSNSFQIVVADEVAVSDRFAFDTRKKHKKPIKRTAKMIKVDWDALENRHLLHFKMPDKE